MDAYISPAALSGAVEAISSKSYAHRLLIAAALSCAPSSVHCPTLSEDIWATVHCLNAMGAEITYAAPAFAVTPITTPTKGVLDCGECGTTLRLLLPVVCALGAGGALTGRGRLPQRPLSPLYEELIAQGAVLSPQGTFPLTVGGQLRPGHYTLAANVSSQFVSGLLFALPLLQGDSTLTLTGTVESRPYLDMTLDVLQLFGVTISVSQDGRTFAIPGTQRLTPPAQTTVEGDWSNGAFWLAAGALGAGVTIHNLNPNSRQGDRAVVDILRQFGAQLTWRGTSITAQGAPLMGQDIDCAQIPDLVPILAVVAAFAQGRTRFYNAQRLRIKESDRIATVCALLTALGGVVEETADGLIVTGAPLTGGTIDSFNDHRIAMAAAVAALGCSAPVTLTQANAVEKSYPHFFADYVKLGGAMCSHKEDTP